MKTAVKHFKDCTMASEVVNKYITKRYERWLDYAKYHSNLAGMPDEAVDVLNEVLYMLLMKDSSFLEGMIGQKKQGCTELDYYVLHMIKINIVSPTSPYQHKYKQTNVDYDVCLANIDIQEPEDDEPQRNPDDILAQMSKVRAIFESLDLSKKARAVFVFRFFADEPFSEWPGKESKKELYEIYNSVLDLIKCKLYGGCLF